MFVCNEIDCAIIFRDDPAIYRKLNKLEQELLNAREVSAYGAIKHIIAFTTDSRLIEKKAKAPKMYEYDYEGKASSIGHDEGVYMYDRRESAVD